MKVKYVGPFTEGVELAATGELVFPGESIDVDEDLADGLLEQPDNWELDDDDLPDVPAPVGESPPADATAPDETTTTDAGDGTTEES